RVGDLAADAAAFGGVGHQHAVAAGEREVGGQRCALVAALLLGDLDQHDLAALDHLLDLVAPQQLGPAPGGVLDLLAADRVDPGLLRDLFDAAVAVAVAVAITRGVVLGRGAAAPGRPARRPLGRLVLRIAVGIAAVGIAAVGIRSVGIAFVGRLAAQPRLLGDQRL